jgi:hypothetical protein
MEFLNYLNLPAKASVDSKVDINVIGERLKEEGKDPALINKYVSSIKIKALVNFETTKLISRNREDFNFEEIQVFEVKIRNDNHISELNEVLQTVFPNPIIMVYSYKDKIMISTSKKRLSKKESGKSVIERIYKTEMKSMLDIDFLEYLKNFNFSNSPEKYLDDYYFSFLNKVLLYHYFKVKGEMPTVDFDFIKAESIINLIYEKQNQVKSLEKQYKLESNISSKIKIDKAIKDLNKEIDSLNDELIGG